MGAACALAAVYVPAFARLFLRKSRAEVEVAQYANDQFLARELFATPGRNALLVVVGMLEHCVVILPDKGLRDHVTAAEWDAVIARMTERLRCRRHARGADRRARCGRSAPRGKAIPRGPANLFADTPIVDGQS